MNLLLIIIILLDGIIIYIFPANFQNLSYFYPMLTVSSIAVIYHYIKKKDYFKKVFIMGIFYDLLYYNIFLYNAFIFLLLAKLDKKIFNNLNHNIINVIIVTVLNIIIYDTLNYVVVYLTRYNMLNIKALFYKIGHSLILNIMIVFVISFICNKLKLKHKI